MFNAMQTPLDSNRVRRASKDVEEEEESEKVSEKKRSRQPRDSEREEKMANGRSMSVWNRLYAVAVPMFLFVVIASSACE